MICFRISTRLLRGSAEREAYGRAWGQVMDCNFLSIIEFEEESHNRTLRHTSAEVPYPLIEREAEQILGLLADSKFLYLVRFLKIQLYDLETVCSEVASETYVSKSAKSTLDELRYWWKWGYRSLGRPRSDSLCKQLR